MARRRRPCISERTVNRAFARSSAADATRQWQKEDGEEERLARAVDQLVS